MFRSPYAIPRAGTFFFIMEAPPKDGLRLQLILCAALGVLS